MKTPQPSETPSARPSDATAPEDEAMILYFYGESADPAGFERELAENSALAERYEALRRELAAIPTAPAPDPGDELAARVWNRIRPELAPHRPGGSNRNPLAGWFGSLSEAFRLRPAFALAAAATLALALGFLLGRGAQTSPPSPDVAEEPIGLSAGARERLLLASVSDHLAGSERLLTRIANSPDDDAAALAEERRLAESLVASNRLYRKAAERAGHRRLVALLDEMEPLLLELAHAPESSEDLSSAQRRIEEKDLLFKLRVAGDRLERSARPAPRSNPSLSS